MNGVNELQLIVTENVIGKLETNISSLETFVAERLKEYSPELYNGDAVSAKKDRASLNSAKNQIAQSRRALMSELMKPYEDFETRCKKLEKAIELASDKLDEIVKVKENEEKTAKKSLIETVWENKNFNLFNLDKIFNQKWLNKTYKLTDIENEINIIIENTYKDLKTIEQYSDNAELLKAKYLETLNIGDTLDWGEELKKNQKKIDTEATTRADREHEEKIISQKKEIISEAKDFAGRDKISSVVAQALEIEKSPSVKEYVVSFTATESQMLGVKNYLTMQGIVYDNFAEVTF